MRNGLSCEEVLDLAAPYVLGALEDDEAEAVREHLASCPEAHAEVEELGAVVPALARSVEEREPRPELKARILAAAAAERPTAMERPTAAPKAAEPPRPVAAEPPRPRLVPDDAPRLMARRGPRAAEWGLRIAAVLAIVALAGWNVVLQGRLGDADRAVQEATYGRAVAAVVEVASRPGASIAVLSPQDGAAGRGIAALDQDGQVRLAVDGLEPTDGSEVYEVWAIVGEEQPRPLGHFLVDESGAGRFDTAVERLGQGDILALTREPAAGASTPTLPIVSLGAVGEASSS